MEMISVAEEGNAENPDFKYIVRIANTDIDGERPLFLGLTAIRGIGQRVAIGLADSLGLDRKMKVGDLTDEQVEMIEQALKEMDQHLPPWMLNRRKDFETGNDIHIYGAEMSLIIQNDINFLKKIRCYRGIRHEMGQKVRGQRTRSNGRTGMTVGVSRRRK